MGKDIFSSMINLRNHVIETDVIKILDNASTNNYYSNLEIVGIFGHRLGVKSIPTNSLAIEYYLSLKSEVIPDLLNQF